MSKEALKLAELAELTRQIRDLQQKIFEKSGGEGQVGDFIERGAGDRFEAMTEVEQSLYLELASTALSEFLVEIP